MRAPAEATANRRGARAPSVRRYLSCIRYREILVLQGSPLLGAAFAMGAMTRERLAALAVLAAASVLLVAHIFTLNDWAGMSADLEDPNKAARVFATKGVSRREIGILSIALLAGGLLLFAVLGPRTLAIASAIALLSLLYSLPAFQAKGVPILNSAIHLVGGSLHFLLGYSPFRAIDGRGVLLSGFFALAFAAGHLTQEVRDHDGDRASGIRTNAVAFGRARTFAASLVLFTLAYAQLLLLAARGSLPGATAALVVLYPLHLYWSVQAIGAGLTFQAIHGLQLRYRALYALIGAALLAELLLGR